MLSPPTPPPTSLAAASVLYSNKALRTNQSGWFIAILLTGTKVLGTPAAYVCLSNFILNYKKSTSYRTTELYSFFLIFQENVYAVFFSSGRLSVQWPVATLPCIGLIFPETAMVDYTHLITF